MRDLKYHEKKLLKKVNLTEWKTTNTAKEQLVTSKYYLHSRDEYVYYNRIVGMIRKLAESLSRLPQKDATRNFITKALLNKLYEIGIIDQKLLSECTKVTVSSICKRRLPMVLTYKKMILNFKDADKFVQQGHIVFGTKVCREPSVLIKRGMEDFIKWREDSKIKRKIDEYNGELDDF
ncbi:IMP3 [Hepatospora eriocheir]|uniref:IMP3 n=1 Tax=Hepatospora eriocheir TaxID=1081669 RepID=A0A1X0QJN1_9MICR|nr:IMP3 [Hepatospora eriocheir]